MNLSVVIPVYNSATILPRLVEELLGVIHPHVGRFEIILVNDSSRDGSWGEISTLCGRFPEVRGLNLRRNTGQHNATMAGLNYACGNVTVIMDDDLQHSPSDVIRLYTKILEGYDVCYTKFEHIHHPLWKRLGSAFNDRVARILLDKPAGVYLSSFKALSAGLREEIIKYTGPYAYIDGLILMTTGSITTLDAEHRARFDGRGNYNLAKSLILWAKMATSFSILPLRLAGIVGALMACIGFLFALVTIFLRFFSNLPIPLGWTSLFVAIIITGGTQLVALGLIGEYLGRTYVMLNNVPQYSVKDFRNFTEGASTDISAQVVS